MKDFDIDLKSDRISVLEEILLTSENENEKLEVINQLVRKKDDRAQLAILKALKDKSWRVREKSINSVRPSSIPGDTLISYLVNLIDDEFAKIREKAIQLLKEMAKKELLPYFLTKLNDESDLVRSIAIQAIGEIGYKEKFESFITQFHSETSMQIKHSLLEAIARIGDETTIDFLIEVLHNERENVELRSEAALALAKSGSSKAFTSIISILNNEIVENTEIAESGVITGFISFPPTKLKIGLIQSLAFINEERTVNFLIDLIREFQKESLLFPSIKNLPNLRGLEQMGDPARIILVIIRVLGLLGNKKVIPILLKSLNSVYDAVRLQSIAALFLFNNDSVNERLLSILTDKNEDSQFKMMMLAIMEQTDEEGLINLRNKSGNILPKRGWEIYKGRLAKNFGLSKRI